MQNGVYNQYKHDMMWKLKNLSNTLLMTNYGRNGIKIIVTVKYQ